MQETNQILIIGLIVLLGFYAGRWIKLLSLPALLGYMLLGIMLGASGAGLISAELLSDLDFVVEFGLAMVAFEVGSALSIKLFRRTGKALMLIILGETLLAYALIAWGVWWFSASLPLALILGAIGAASAPAGTVAVIQDYHARGPMTNTLYAVVGFDDGVSVILFGLSLVAAKMLLFDSANTVVTQDSWSQWLIWPFVEVIASVLVGIFLGGLLWQLVRRLHRGTDTLIVTLGVVLILTGLSALWHLSLVLSCMAAGMLIVNMGKDGVTHRIRTVSANVMPLVFVVFFALAGAHLDLASVATLGIVGISYLLARAIGKFTGAWLGGWLGGMSGKTSALVGLSLLSQAGLAIGLALIVRNELNGVSPQAAELGGLVLAVVTSTTVIFEVIGPVLARFALFKAGEIRQRKSHNSMEGDPDEV